MTSRDILEPIQRGRWSENLETTTWSKEASSRDTAAQGTWGSLRGDHTVTAVRAGILGQNVDMKFKVGRGELQDACLIMADARLGLSRRRADLGLAPSWDTDLRQPIVIELRDWRGRAGAAGLRAGDSGGSGEPLWAASSSNRVSLARGPRSAVPAVGQRRSGGRVSVAAATLRAPVRVPGRIARGARGLVQPRLEDPRPAGRAGLRGRDIRPDRWAMTLE